MIDGSVQRPRDWEGADPASDEVGQARRWERTSVERERKSDIDERSGHPLRTVASWFSGVGGIDLGFELAGFRLVSVSEIEPFPSAVLATHWPGVPNLGDITQVVEQSRQERLAHGQWKSADVWTGGFPCQDLSIAGARRGLHDDDGNRTRSGLALAFLELAARYKPSWIILENVTGLLNSHDGEDLRTLLREISQLRYGWAFRVLNSAHFGVPQRRRRVFIVATLTDPTGERAGKVLDIAGSRRRYLAESAQKGQEDGPAPVTGIDIAGTLSARYHKSINSTIDDGAIVLRETIDAGRGRKATGFPRWLDHSIPGVVEAQPQAFRKVHRAANVNDPETWAETETANTLNAWDIVNRDTHLVIQPELNPKGYDTNRYKAMGNAVSVPVAYWLGKRLMQEMEDDRVD